jgi:hypothetical protein
VLSGSVREALAYAEGLRSSHPAFRPAEVGLLFARALEAVNRLEEALAEFGVLATTYPGEEGRWRYGALLKRVGRVNEAQAVFRTMLRNAERMSEPYRAAQREWLELARQSLQA